MSHFRRSSKSPQRNSADELRKRVLPWVDIVIYSNESDDRSLYAVQSPLLAEIITVNTSVSGHNLL